MTAPLKVTAKGQITLRREFLRHLGVGPGDRLLVELAPGGTLQMRPAPSQKVEALFGLLARPGTRPISMDEMNDAIEAGWAGET